MRPRLSMAAALAAALTVAAVAALAGAEPAATSAEAVPPNPLTQTLRQVRGLRPAAREARLLQLAKAEGGTLEWYTSLSSPISQAVERAFEQKYGLTVNRYRAGSEAVAQRIVEEARANRAGADVIETNGTEMLHFQHRKNILVPYTSSPYRAAVPKTARFNAFTASRMEYFIVAWNRNILPAGGPPRTFQDLANARFRGKLSMEPTDTDWYAQLWTHYNKTLKWSPARINTMFRNIARNSVLTSSHTTQANLLAAGQFSVVISAHAQSVKNLVDDGAPLVYTPFVRPVIQRPQGVGVAYRAPHPATAMLFYDWLLMKNGGQTVLKENNSEPARRDLFDREFQNSRALIYMNLRPIIANWARWSREYEALTRLATGG
jgi:iron(III) transport system substrate-binding protein